LAASVSRELYGFENFWRHYRRCRANKRNAINALRFELDAESNLLRLREELAEHTYRPGRSICFVTDGPKPREVFAADFRDRVVHHVLVAAQERVFEPRFIHDSFACRVGKGTLAASDRLTTFLRRATANGHRAAWALKLDVASFFTSASPPLCHGHGQRALRPASPQTSSTTSPPPERHTRHRPAAAVSATPCARDQPPGHARRLPMPRAAAPVPAREGLGRSATKHPENSEPVSLQEIMIPSSQLWTPSSCSVP
jgi:hypothetical protein